MNHSIVYLFYMNSAHFAHYYRLFAVHFRDFHFGIGQIFCFVTVKVENCIFLVSFVFWSKIA